MSGGTLRLRLRTHPSQPGPLVTAYGSLDQTNVDTFARVIQAALAIPEARALSLRLDQVTFIDVAGVAALVQARRRAQSTGLRFAVIAVSRQVRAGLLACRAGHLLPAPEPPPVKRCVEPSRPHAHRRGRRRFCSRWHLLEGRH